MGQKVHPVGIRLGIVKDHNSIWYADSKNYSKQLITDLEVRAYIEKARIKVTKLKDVQSCAYKVKTTANAIKRM